MSWPPKVDWPFKILLTGLLVHVLPDEWIFMSSMRLLRQPVGMGYVSNRVWIGIMLRGTIINVINDETMNNGPIVLMKLEDKPHTVSRSQQSRLYISCSYNMRQCSRRYHVRCVVVGWNNGRTQIHYVCNLLGSTDWCNCGMWMWTEGGSKLCRLFSNKTSSMSN